MFYMQNQNVNYSCNRVNVSKFASYKRLFQASIVYLNVRSPPIFNLGLPLAYKLICAMELLMERRMWKFWAATIDHMKSFFYLTQRLGDSYNEHENK